MDLVAAKHMRYAGKVYETGDSFSATSRDGRILVAIGKAKAAEPAAETKADAKDSRKYKRRDMRAE